MNDFSQWGVLNGEGGPGDSLTADSQHPCFHRAQPHTIAISSSSKTPGCLKSRTGRIPILCLPSLAAVGQLWLQMAASAHFVVLPTTPGWFLSPAVPRAETDQQITATQQELRAAGRKRFISMHWHTALSAARCISQERELTTLSRLIFFHLTKLLFELHWCKRLEISYGNVAHYWCQNHLEFRLLSECKHLQPCLPKGYMPVLSITAGRKTVGEKLRP